MNVYVAQIVSVVEDRWYETGYDDSPLVRSQKRYFLTQRLLVAPDADAAYRRVRAESEADTDCNHDGEGHKTFFYDLGIHEIERLDWPPGEFARRIQAGESESLGTFARADLDRQGLPRVRSRDELLIFRSDR